MTKALHQFHRTWIEQCEATEGIRLRHGAESAFDYVVGEKLFSYAAAALICGSGTFLPSGRRLPS